MLNITSNKGSLTNKKGVVDNAKYQTNFRSKKLYGMGFERFLLENNFSFFDTGNGWRTIYRDTHLCFIRFPFKI